MITREEAAGAATSVSDRLCVQREQSYPLNESHDWRQSERNLGTASGFTRIVLVRRSNRLSG